MDTETVSYGSVLCQLKYTEVLIDQQVYSLSVDLQYCNTLLYTGSDLLAVILLAIAEDGGFRETLVKIQERQLVSGLTMQQSALNVPDKKLHNIQSQVKHKTGKLIHWGLTQVNIQFIVDYLG